MNPKQSPDTFARVWGKWLADTAYLKRRSRIRNALWLAAVVSVFCIFTFAPLV